MNILVIGNGFDLEHGLETKYTQFLNFVESFRSVSSNEAIMKSGGLMNTAKEKYEKMDGMLFESPEIGEEFGRIVKRNHWIDYFISRRNDIGEDWIDFESEIFAYLDQLRSWSKEEKKMLLDDLYSLIRALEIYLDYHVFMRGVPDKSPIIDQFKADHIVNFNYTSTYERVYEGIEKLNIDYVHGRADCNRDAKMNNMVLGIRVFEDEEKQDRYMDFCKFYQRVLKDSSDYRTEQWIKSIEEDYDRFKAYMVQSKDLAIANTVDIDEPEKEYSEYLSRATSMEEMVKTHFSPSRIAFFGHSMDPTDAHIIKPMLMCNGADKMIYYRNVEQKESEIKNILKIISREEFEKRVSSKNIVFVNQNKEELVYHGGHD